ncbi:hypothetical protein HJC23_008264 [Cyclotella cryptica]|uniref:Uncharacterized protein n=1 Tax=Cyclotella cryptica TaxID=29204 RepID=A0ABD3NX92_9STRA|eukprot:CCRYP_019121-RF/>CCRYP_019121-RF protein AED:0.04 eAED:0.04 QI:546/1/1/1/0.2/0/6/3833/507
MASYLKKRTHDAYRDIPRATTPSSDNFSDLNQKHYLTNIEFDFHDALKYQGPIHYPSAIAANRETTALSTYEPEPIPVSQVQAYESAMQYVVISDNNDFLNPISSFINQLTLTNLLRSTVERCSLVRRMVRVVAIGDSYAEVAEEALKNGSFEDMMENGVNAHATWSIRLRRYGSAQHRISESAESNIDNHKDNRLTYPKTKQKRQARYGKNVRSSLTDEKNAIFSMSELIKLFQGKVNLMNPDCKIYILEGLRDFSLNNRLRGSDDNTKILLGRVIANGPKTSIYSPKTRICVTTTPLCPIASFTLCNIAQTQRNTNTAILDPFAGSCATLLAAAHITKGQCRSVGIEICHDGYVNRNDIKRDFDSRSLPPPLVIRGDCLSSDVRDRARAEMGGNECFPGFDVIVTDPPYGIREAMSSSPNLEFDTTPPLTQLFQVIAQDKAIGKPLLKVGGRLAAFVPVRKGETLEECLPPADVQKDAGLVLEGEGKEQVLNDILSRWLVSFVGA